MKKIPNTIIVEHCGSDHLRTIDPVCTEETCVFPKPKGGGLWTSPTDTDNSWRDWCTSENFNMGRLEKSFRLEVSTENLLVIDCYEDLEETMIRTHIIERREDGLTYFKWEELLKKYDGIWLTVKGEAETRYAHPCSLYGWDCETVFLFNDRPIIKEL